jgi:hypothetical protein
VATIVLVVANAGSLTTGDTVIRDRLQAAGHTVVLRNDEDPEYTGAYDGVFISDSCSGGTVSAKYDTVAKPGITAENVTWRLGTYLGAIDGTQWTVENTDGNGGLTGTQTVYTATMPQQGIDTDVLPAGATVVARLTGDSDHGVYVRYAAGGALTSGTAPAKRVFLRIGDGAMASLTAAGVQLLDAAIEWAFGPAAPIEKQGGDTALSTESGGVSATVSSGETAHGTEAGSAGPRGSEDAIGTEDGYVAEGRDGADAHGTTESGDVSATSTSGETATATEVYDSAATIDPPAETAIAADEGHIAIPGEDVTAAFDAHVAPTQVTSTPPPDLAFGQEGGYIETLYGDLIVTLFAVDAETGELTVLPDYESLSISRERNSKGAIRLDYPASGKGFELLRGAVTGNRDLEIEIWTNGTPNGALRGYLQEGQGDDVAEDSSWTFAGSLLEVRTDETILYPQSRGEQIVDPDTGELVWSNPNRELILNADTPGEVLALLLEQAQDRGALTDIERDFTTTEDSNGAAWAGVISGKFSPGVTYTQILERMVTLGLIEWAIVWDWQSQRKLLKVWNAGGRGTDLTLGSRPVVLRRGRNLLDAPRKWSVREAGTHLLAAGDEGLYEEAGDSTALERRDRRVERYASLNGATTDEALLAFAQAELTTVVKGLQVVEHGIGMLPGEPRPIIAYDIGDWVYSLTTTEPERLRVVQWQIDIDADRQLTGKVALNDTWADAMEKLRRQLNAIQSGEAVVGTSESPPDTGVDRTPPAAPEGLVATSIAYQDPDHTQPLAMVHLSWLPVTTNADGADNPLVQAAVFILDKIEDDATNPPEPDPDQEDGGPDYDPFDPDTWTWKNCPQIVRDFAAQLRGLWVDDGSPTPETDWLANYIAEMSQTPTAAEDVAGYRVRYAFMGLEQVGGIPSSDPFPEDERVYWEVSPANGISGTVFSFGGVDAGSRLRIEVCAFDRNGNQGAWSTISHDCAEDATPPPVPSAPSEFKAWFRTLDITWDGLGAEGETMPADFSHVRVWVGQGADMTLPEDEPGQLRFATPFDPNETGPQYVANLHASGTWNVPDVPLGVGWYACFQAVDRHGNASARSDVVGPVFAEQLVGDDLIDEIIDATKLGPDSVQTLHIVDGALTSAKIQDAAIIRAKIADLAVNDAKIETLSAGKITTGTLFANVTLSGQIRTSADPSANRVEMDAAGLRLYRGATLVGDWKVEDGTILVTGTYRSGLTGKRVEITPDGTFRIYPPSGTNAITITNEGNDIVWRGPLTNQRSGRLNVNTLGVGLNYSQEQNLLDSITSEFVLFDRRMRQTAPFIHLEVSERWSNPAGGDQRVQFSAVDDNGDTYPYAHLNYLPSSGSNSNRPALVGNTVGLVFMGGGGQDARLEVRHATGSWSNWLNVHANSLVPSSSREVKEDIEDLRKVIDPLETIRQARARKFIYSDAPQREPRVGLIAEELPEILQNDDAEVLGIDLVQVVGTLWGAINQLLDQETRIVTGRNLVPNGTYRDGDVVDVSITWDEPAPEVPTDVTATALASMPTAMGKIRALVVPGSVTETGCTIRLTFSGIGPTVVNNALPIAVETVGRYIYTPPPPEE